MSNVVLEVGQGTDTRYVLALKTKDSDGNLVPFDLSGYSAAMQLRTAAYSPQAQDTLTTANGRLEIDATAGKIALTFPHEVTESYPVRTFVFDVEIKNLLGEITRILSGRIRVTAEVTRDVQM